MSQPSPITAATDPRHSAACVSAVSRTVGRPAKIGGESISVFALIAIVGLACGGHLLVAQWWLPVQTSWFVATGFGFLLVTAGAHRVLSRGIGGDPLVSLLVSMSIRLVGTFAILGGLWVFSPLERPEAVFNILFWYITLTAIDLTAIVRERNHASASLVSGHSSSNRSLPDQPLGG